MTLPTILILWFVCGFAAATLHQSNQDRKRQRGYASATWAYFGLGPIGLLAAMKEWREG